MANGLKKQKQKWKALAKHKSSLVLYLITILSAAITVFVLGYLIVYILARPCACYTHYSAENRIRTV